MRFAAVLLCSLFGYDILAEYLFLVKNALESIVLHRKLTSLFVQSTLLSSSQRYIASLPDLPFVINDDREPLHCNYQEQEPMLCTSIALQSMYTLSPLLSRQTLETNMKDFDINDRQNYQNSHRHRSILLELRLPRKLLGSPFEIFGLGSQFLTDIADMV